MARDIVLTNVFGIETGLATQDVDFAVAIANWGQFELVKEKLLETGQFTSSERITHCVYYKNQDGKRGYPVDIIPFGGVEAPPNSIQWPRERGVVMNVIGYAETLESTLSVEIAAEFIVPIASLPSLALLKLFAWQDRWTQTQKDARDIVVISKNYIEAGNVDRIYGNEIALLEAVDYNVDLASPRLLGRDIRRVASTTTLDQVRRLLANKREFQRLVTHMSAQLRDAEDSIVAAEQLLENIRAGLFDQA